MESNDICQEEHPLEWGNACGGGWLLKSDGFPVSEEAARHAYEVFNAIADEARSHHFTCDRDCEGFENSDCEIVSDKLMIIEDNNS